MAFEIERPPEAIPHPATDLDVGEVVCQAVAATEDWDIQSKGLRDTFRSPQIAEVENGSVYNVRSWPIPPVALDEEWRTLRIIWDRDEWDPGMNTQEALQHPIGVHVQEITYLGSRLGLPWTRHSVLVHNPTGPSYGMQTEFLFDTLTRRPSFAVALPFCIDESERDQWLQPRVSWAFLRACGVDIEDRIQSKRYVDAAVSPMTQEDCQRIADEIFVGSSGITNQEKHR